MISDHSASLIDGREPNTWRNMASRARRCGCWSRRMELLPSCTTSACAARIASPDAAARAAGIPFSSAVSSRSRHAGYHDAEKIKELPARFESGVHGPLRLPGELIQLNTTEPIELDALAERIRPLL